MTATEDRLAELNEWLHERGMGAYWMRGEGEGPGGPPVKPRLARKADIYPALLKSGELVPVGPQGMVEMRLVSAQLGSSTISLGHQILMPGERTRAHRNVKNEIRFVLEAPPEAVFVVEGEAFPMEPGDLITAPTWTTHDHWNRGDRPSIWLDGLDMGLTRFGVDINERYPEDDQYQAIDRPTDYARRTGGHVQPVGIEREYVLPPMRYPWSETYATLMALKASEAECDPYDGIRLMYTNPVDGGPTVRTMSCEVQLLSGGLKTEVHRHSCTTLYYAHCGVGCTVVEDERLEWAEGDLFSVPSWTWHQHENRSAEDAILYSVSDWPAMQALGFYAEESRG
jgi:1-hydroxy-2-naphthoate dioxygenase